MAGVAEDEIEHQEAGENVEQFAVAEPPPEEEEFVEDDPAVDEEMAFHERVVYYASSLEHFSFSDQEIECMERMMSVVYGMAPPIRYRSHVRPMIQDVLREYDHRIHYFCNSCSGLLDGRFGLCTNINCPLFRVDVNRAKHSQRAEVHLVNIVPQLENVISAHFGEPVHVHARIHDEESQEHPVAILFEGKTWSVSVSLYLGVADMAAQNALFGTHRWTSDFGCSKCLLQGTWHENQRLWIAEQRADLVLRTPEFYLNDGRLQANGVPAVTTAMNVLPPSAFSSDALHVCSEGLTRERLRDLFTRDSKFNELRINNNNTIGLMKQSLQRTKSHTYSNAIILSLDDLPMCKASELDEIAFVVFPLVAAIEALPDQIATASLIGYWLCLRMMASTWELSVDRIGVARVASLTKELWMALAPKIFTMKCHWFFDHAMQEELEQYGSTYQWSSAPFESHHRRLQIKINQTTTASSSVIIDKFLLAKKLRLQVVERSENSADMRKLSRLIDNTYRTRFPVGVFVTEDLYIPKYSEIQRAELREDDRGYLRLQADDIPYSRVVVRDTVYSSKIYWKRQPSSQQDVVYLTGTSNGQPYEAFENVIMFLCNPTSNNIKAAAASSINRFSYDGFEEIIDVKMFQTLFTIATQLTVGYP
ncbi:hypothetical protein Q1695_006239 [Nippostrongylus brasiliensis]|nr:hypothetical protein Q1695_006239 [Nippostrongylus brasiliensis]